jgi:aerobic carbon-monoxide dehydrogenase medium subunit
VKPAPLEYKRATSVSHALALLGELGDEAKPVAGGQSLIPLLNLRLARPAVLIDINDIEADDLDVVDDCLITGALVRHRQLYSEAVVASAQPLLAHSARFIGHGAIRNRGTVGGSLVHADAAAELSLVAVACEARIVVASSEQVREVPAEDFFVGPFMSALAPDELVLAVQWPTVGDGELWGFAEVAERAGDFAMAAAAVKINIDGAGTRRPVVAVAGLGGTPTRLPAAEEVLRSASWEESQLREAVRDVLASHQSSEGGGVPGHTHHLVTEMVTRAARQSQQ